MQQNGKQNLQETMVLFQSSLAKKTPNSLICFHQGTLEAKYLQRERSLE